MLSRRAVLGGGMAACLSIVPLTSAEARARGWPHDARGAVSITYDDGLDSQLDLAVPTLDALGVKATFFVTMDNIRHRLGDWAALAGRGHELADHTVSHPCDLRRFTPRWFVDHQIKPMERWLTSVDPHRQQPVYAYPCDVTNLGAGSANVQAHRYARLLRNAGIVAARTSEGEPNNPARLRARAYRLQALAAGYDAPTVEAVLSYLDLAERRGHWAILVFHEIGDSVPQQGEVTRSLHDDVLRHIASSRLWAAPMGEAFSRLG